MPTRQTRFRSITGAMVLSCAAVVLISGLAAGATIASGATVTKVRQTDPEGSRIVGVTVGIESATTEEHRRSSRSTRMPTRRPAAVPAPAAHSHEPPPKPPHVVTDTRSPQSSEGDGGPTADSRPRADDIPVAPDDNALPTVKASAAPAPLSQVVFRESGDGPDAAPYASTAGNGAHPLWFVESGSAQLSRLDGSITKVDGRQFHRVFSTKRFGGPGTSLRISYRARATSLRNSGSATVAGVKFGLKFPQPQKLTGYSKEDPRSVLGSPGAASSPGSYQFLTGITEGGYMELARNPGGTGNYKWWPNKKVGYSPGTWKDIVVTVDWLDASTMRVRYWHNADGSGAPVYEALDTSSPFARESGFLWLRTDDANFAYDHITVEQG